MLERRCRAGIVSSQYPASPTAERPTPTFWTTDMERRAIDVSTIRWISVEDPTPSDNEEVPEQGSQAEKHFGAYYM
jgi:hypothetical protein